MNHVCLRRSAALFIFAATLGLGACAAPPQQRVVEVAIHDDGGKRRSDREEIMLLADGMGYVINGKEFPMTEPIHMKMGERVRVRMANLGAMYHPMHLQKPVDPSRRASAV